jgi:hypothetical protein
MGGGKSEEIEIDRSELLAELQAEVDKNIIDMSKHVTEQELSDILGIGMSSVAARRKNLGIEVKKWNNGARTVNVIHKDDAMRIIKGV